MSERSIGGKPAPGCPGVACGNHARVACHARRSTIIFLISAIAFAGLRCSGQVWAQFMMVWQR